MNIHALVEELDDAVARGTAERRAQILNRITDVFVAGAAGYSANQIEMFGDVFVRVSAAIEMSARTTLASRLAKMPRAPSAITRALASDDAIEVAGPVLEQSDQLDNETLVAMAQTKSQRHLLAISRRSMLDESVTDILVERGDKPVVLSTAGNPAARFSDRGFQTLVKRSDGDDELATRVALRPDIPREHLARLLVRASHAVQTKLEAANPSMAGMIQAAVADAATKILDNAGTLSRDYKAARTHVESLRSAGQLGESELAAFTAANRFEETTAALAVLCNLSIDAVDQAMTHDRPETVLIMLKAIEMSWPTAKAILRMRAGPRGISPGELEQCQGIYSRLKLATARQFIAYQGKRPRDRRFSRPAA